MRLHPDEDTTKILISTTSRFVGEYVQDDLLITHAWPSGHRQAEGNLGLTENPMSRNYFVLAVRTQPPDRLKTIAIPNYTPTGDVVSIYLSILFGKRFDNHGRIESNGHFYLPHISGHGMPCSASLPFNSHAPRRDLSIPLNLSETQRIRPLLSENPSNARFKHLLLSAGRFYLHALQEAESQPEIAFLDLITCGEILSSFFKYDQDDLLDETLKQDLARISTCLEGGEAVVRRIRGSLYQVRRKFTTTVLRLLSPYFFQQTDAKEQFCALKVDDIVKRIKAAYDLRSRYVHTGLDFGNWLMSTAYHEEIQLHTPVVDDEKFKNLLVKSPTFGGLERIMRFCLLRFIHLHGCSIDERLSGQGLSNNGMESNEDSARTRCHSRLIRGD
jgi:hypothetical protein